MVNAMRVPRVVIGSLTLAALPACGPSGPDLDQVTRDQREIFVKLVYKQFPLTAIHDNAMNAAKAAIAADKQGKFWEMHDLLYQNQSALGIDKLTEYAGTIGLDVPHWVKDFSSAAVQEQVVQEM